MTRLLAISSKVSDVSLTVTALGMARAALWCGPEAIPATHLPPGAPDSKVDPPFLSN